MRIGLDIRPLQSHHSVRGIGMHINALVRWIMKEYKGDDSFVFYVYEELPNPIEEFPDSSTKYEIVYLSDYRNIYPVIPSIVSASISYVRRVLTPIPKRLAKKCDVFLGFDFMLGMPKTSHVNYAIIGYDLIPIMYEHQYLPNFREAQKEVGTRQALFSAVTAHLYKRAVMLLKKRGVRIISISDNSKEQFVRFGNISPDNIRTVYLGNPISNNHFVSNPDDLGRVKRYSKNSFLLFIGGTDWRRRIDDLVSAYNILRAQGNDIKLLLAGYDFRNINTITDKSSRESILNSSYSSDIELLGFINDSEKKYLYENALAFVFPSLCEGFGLPILEAMQEKCPVIAYNGPLSSMAEVADKGARIIKPGHVNIYRAVNEFQQMSMDQRKMIEEDGMLVVERFSWQKCAEQTIETLKDSTFFKKN